MAELINAFIEASISRSWITGLTPGTVSDAELDELEHSIDLSYPPLYRYFLKAHHFNSFDCVLLRFESHPNETWKQNLDTLYHRAWSPDRILEIGLIPFGMESLAEAGPVCFDTRDSSRIPDYSVVVWDHDWVGSEKEIFPLFSSSEAMYRCLLFFAKQEINFFYHDEEVDSAEELENKRKLLKDFLDLDPLGAGGQAIDYWTAWDVDSAG
jgi:hypothetical protein